jgi:hypothetical protein
MKAIRQNNTNRKEKAKMTSPKHQWEDYYCNISFKMKPANETTRENFALKWVETARNDPKYINIWEYPVMGAGMFQSTVHDWEKKDQNVANAHKYVRCVCAIRRDKGAASKELDGSWIAKTMPIYCDDYKALEEWRAHLSEKIASAGGLKVVELEKFADSDLVPKKEKRDSK